MYTFCQLWIGEFGDPVSQNGYSGVAFLPDKMPLQGCFDDHCHVAV
jgi:hypothetical protein